MRLGHPITDIGKKISRLELEIKRLKNEKASRESLRESLPEDKRLAIILQECSWKLDEVLNPSKYWEFSEVHIKYLERARKILRERKFEDIVTILRLL